MSRYSRRSFLSTVGGAAAAAPLLPLAGCQTAEAATAPASGDGPAGAAPEVVRSGRVVDVTLTSERVERTFEAGTATETRARLRAYNGQIPGPLLELRPGDHLRVRLENRLPPTDSAGWTGDHNVPHALDTTNLHFHGLSVIPHLFQPVGTSDPTAEMIAVRPGEDLVYEIPIPDDQPDGLYWYHPHHHGSTVVQAVTGMAGGIVVRGPVDEVPEVAAAAEHVLVFNDIGLFPSEDGSDVWEYEPKQNSLWDTLGNQVEIWDPSTETMIPAPDLKGGFSTGDYKRRYYLVNGEPFFREDHNFATGPKVTPPGCPPHVQFDPGAMPLGTQLAVPRITMRPGEVARFRLLNAMSDNVMPIAVEGHDLHLIELDGVNFPTPRTLPVVPVTNAYPDQQLLLAPANRASFMLKANATPGVYKVMQLAQCAQFLYSSPRVLAEIEVVGDPVTMALPTALPIPAREYPLISPDEVKRVRNVVFSMQFEGGLNPLIKLDFMINNTVYDERSVQAVVNVGDVEEWHLTVPSMMEGGSEGHPFHIHVNSFEVISITNLSKQAAGDADATTVFPPGTIQDTIWVPADHTVVIRSTFKQWTGKAVYHCHILPHEDTGMMQNFLILPEHSGH